MQDISVRSAIVTTCEKAQFPLMLLGRAVTSTLAIDTTLACTEWTHLHRRNELDNSV